MSETEKTPKPTQSQILAAGMLLAILVIGIFMSSATGGGGSVPNCSNNVPSQLQCGSLTVTATTGNSVGIASVTFPTAFAATPSTIHAFAIPTFAQLSFQFIFYDLITLVAPTTGSITWAAMPNAETEFLGLTIDRTNAIFQSVQNVALIANVQSAGAAGAILKAQYFNATSATWIDICGSGTDKPQASIATTGVILGPQCGVPLALANFGPVQIRIAGKGGDGVTSPQFGTISLREGIFMNITPYAAVVNPGFTGFTIVIQFGVVLTSNQNMLVKWDAEL